MNQLSDILFQIPNGKFLLNLTYVQVVRGSRTVRGTGYVQLSQEGILVLTIINANPPGIKENEANSLFNFFNDKGFDQTVIITADDYYQFNGVDEFGNTVSCKHINLDSDNEQRVYTASFQSNVWVSSPKVNAGTRFDKATILLKNKYSFATNADEAWRIKFDDFILTYNKRENEPLLEVFAGGGSALNDKILVNMLQALDFVMGVEHREYFTFYELDFEHYQAEISIRAYTPILDSYFTPPYRRTGSQGDEAEVNGALFTSYFNYIRSKEKSLLTKWNKRIVDSGTGYYYRHGLISVAVEKILDKFYKTIVPLPEKNLLLELAALKSSLINYSDPTLIKNLKDLIDKLSGKGSFIPKTRLIQLENEDVVSAGAQKSWSNLRNAYAHGTDYNDEMVKAIELVRENVTLYYELIFHLIGYKGRYTNYFVKTGDPLAVYPPK